MTATERPSAWPSGVLNRTKTLEVLTQHNAWRRGAKGRQTDPVLLGKALDAAIAHIATLDAAPADPVVSDPAVHLNDDGALDEIVGAGPFHLEQMDDGCWWMQIGPHSVTLTSREQIVATLSEDEYKTINPTETDSTFIVPAECWRMAVEAWWRATINDDTWAAITHVARDLAREQGRGR